MCADAGGVRVYFVRTPRVMAVYSIYITHLYGMVRVSQRASDQIGAPFSLNEMCKMQVGSCEDEREHSSLLMMNVRCI